MYVHAGGKIEALGAHRSDRLNGSQSVGGTGTQSQEGDSLSANDTKVCDNNNCNNGDRKFDLTDEYSFHFYFSCFFSSLYLFSFFAILLIFLLFSRMLLWRLCVWWM